MTEALDTNKAERLHTVKRRIAWVALTGVALGVTASAEDIKPNFGDDFVMVAVGDSILSGTTEQSSREFFDCQSDQISSIDIAARNMGVKAITAACYGSSIPDMAIGRFNQPSQYDSLDENADVVLMSAGANAVNLSELVDICLDGSCDYDDPEITHALNTVNSDELKEDMKQAHQKITEQAPNAHIIQYQYYEIIEEDSFCGLALNVWAGKNISGLVDSYITTLNETIESAVNESKEDGIPIDILPPTRNMAPCDSGFTTLYLDFLNSPRSFGHPTPRGHELIADNLQRRLASLSIDWGRAKTHNELAEAQTGGK